MNPGLRAWGEATLEYHPSYGVLLTHEQACGPCLVGSLTGAVASPNCNGRRAMVPLGWMEITCHVYWHKGA